jgi:hypothetical protein
MVEAGHHVRGGAIAARQGRLARYAILPNISLEPQDCLLFGMALR